MLNVKKIFVLLSAVTALVFIACGNIIDPDPIHNNRYTAVSEFSFTIDAIDKSKLELGSINGGVVIVGDENADNVVVAGEKIVKSDNEMDAQSYLKNLKVSIAESGKTLYVTSEQPENTQGRDVSIEYEIRVPASWTCAVELVNGQVAADSLRRDLMIKVTNGNVSLQEMIANAYIRVTNGQIDGCMTLRSGGTVDAETTNGIITMRFPQSTSAQLTAKVTNGTVNVSGLTLDNMYGSQKEIHGTIGSGDGTIMLKTTNGNITVMGY